MADARFEFDTNIEEIRRRIHAGLNQIARDTAQQQGKPVPTAATDFAGSASYTAAAATQSIQNLGRQFEREMRAGRPTGGGFSRQINEIYKDASLQITRDMERAIGEGLDPQDAMRGARRAQTELRTAVEQIHRETKDSLLAAAKAQGLVPQGARNVPVDVIGRGGLQTQRIDAAFEQRLMAAAQFAQERAALDAERKAPRAPAPAAQAPAGGQQGTIRQGAGVTPQHPDVKAIIDSLDLDLEAAAEFRVRKLKERILAESQNEEGPNLDRIFRDIDELSKLDPDSLRDTDFDRLRQAREAESARKAFDQLYGLDHAAAIREEADRKKAAEKRATLNANFEAGLIEGQARAEDARRTYWQKIQQIWLEGAAYEEDTERERRERYARRLEHEEAVRLNKQYDRGMVNGQGEEQLSPTRMLFGAPNSRQPGMLSAQSLLGAMATTGRYAVAGALIYGMGAAMADTVREAMDFSDSMNALQEAVERFNVTATEGAEVTGNYVNQLSDISQVAGGNVGQALDTALRTGRAFTQPGEQSTQEFLDVAKQASDTASQLALITNTDLTDATGNVIAIGQAFGLTHENLSQVNDAIANAKDLGGDPKQISQGLASIAGAAQEAGYSLSETASVISLVQSQTDQTGLATATRLSRIFQMISGENGQRAMEGAGVDTTQSIRDQINQLAGVYDTLNKSQQDQIKTALGGTSALRELLPLLNHNEKLVANFDQALQSAGRGEEEFNRKAQDLVGIFREIQGSVSNIQTGLFRSEIFQPLEVLVVLLREALDFLDEFLQLWNLIPDPIQRTVMAVAQLVALYKLLNRFAPDFMASARERLDTSGARAARTPMFIPGRDGANTVLPGYAGTSGARFAVGSSGVITDRRPSVDPAERTRRDWALFRPAGEEVRRFGNTMRDGTLGVRSALTTFTNSVRAAGASGILAGGRDLAGRGAQGARNALNSEIGAIGALVTGLMAISAAWDAGNEYMKTLASSVDMRFEQNPGSAGEFRQSALDLRTAAENLEQASGGIFGNIADFFNGGAGERTAELLRGNAASDEAAAAAITRIREEAARGSRDRVAAAVDVTSPEGVAEGLKLLADSGRHADTQIDALIGSLNQLGRTGSDAARRLRPEQASIVGVTASNYLQRNVREAGARSRDQRGFWYDKVWGYDLAENVEEMSDEELGRLGKSIDDATSQFLRDNGGVVSPEQVNQLVKLNQEKAKQNWKNFNDLNAEEQAAAMAAVAAATREAIGTQFDADASMVGQAFDTIAAAGPGLAQASGARAGVAAGLRRGNVQEAAATRTLARLRELRGELVAAGQREGRDPAEVQAALEQFDDAIAQAELEAMEAVDARIEALRALMLSAIPQEDIVGRLQRQQAFLQQDYRKTTDPNERNRLQAQMTENARAIADAQVESTNATLRANIDPGDAVAQANEAIAAIDREMANTVQMGAGDRETAAFAALREKRKQAVRTAAQAEVARAVAVMNIGIGPDDTVGQAQAAIAEIDAMMRTIPKYGADGRITQEWAQFERQRREAVAAGIDAEVSRANAVGAANVDPRNSGAQIQQQIDAVRYQMANTQRTDIFGNETEAYANLRKQLGELLVQSADHAREQINAQERAGVNPLDSVAVAQQDLREAQRELLSLLPGQDGYWEAVARVTAAQQSVAKAMRGRTNARERSLLDPESQLQQAEQAVREANREVQALRPNEDGYWEAQAALKRAQIDLAKAQREHAANLRLLTIDMTSPVEMAQEATRRAREELEAARARGASPDVIAGLEVQARQAEQNEVATRFSHEMSLIKRRRDLGQISHGAYLDYLRAEERRLQAAQDGSWMLQDQLLQVQEALKAATESASGMWNFGDIDVPTPYQMARSLSSQRDVTTPGTVKAAVMPGVTPISTQTSHVNIQVNGADTGAVLEMLHTYLGGQASGAYAYTSGRRF